MPSCAHCLLDIPPESSLREDDGGREIHFCCPGCRGIYRLLQSEGLADFYRRRSGWVPGPPEPFAPDLEDLAGSVTAGREGDEATLAISGIRCATCAWVIERYLGGRKGVSFARVNTATGRARIRWNPESAGIADIAGWIRDLGYTPHPVDSCGPEENLDREKRDLLLRFGTAAFFSMQVMTFSAGLYAGYFQGIEPKYAAAFKALSFVLTTPVIFYAGFPFLRNALAGIRHRIVGMDALVFLGSFSAYAYSAVMLMTGGDVYFDTAGMIITLILLGRYLEAAARSKASASLTRLIRLAPRQARRRVGGGNEGLSPRTEAVPASLLRPGDVVEVAPGEKIPADGRVVEGMSEADESLLTGEAAPVPKLAESEVYAGTINGWGRLAVEVVKTGRESALSCIVRAVEEAQARKAPIQNVADRVVGVFVPAVIAVALLALAFRLLSGDSPVAALLASVSVLVVACPCALGLAIPLAVVVASGTARTGGILIKGGDVLEAGAKVTEVFLDKTGTLTEGIPRLADVIGFGEPEERVLRLAASLESPSEHPLARAIRKGAEGRGLLNVTEFRSHPGMGVEGIVGGRRLFLGRAEFLSHHGVPLAEGQRAAYRETAEARKTAVLLGDGERVLGLLSAVDTVRKEAAVSVERLKEDGYRVRLVTGDSGPVASRVAREAGIDEVLSRVTPAEKAEMIRSARSAGGRILMVGDGVNDAPALVEADVGMAMGRGTDVAIESADAVLTGGDLLLVHRFLALSRKTMRVIRQNLAWAFSYNLVAIPFAVTGHLHPILAAGLMSASSLVVAGNSLRLKKG